VSSVELIFISDAARILDMHPQTLRKYERLGLVRPARTVGSMRLYSRDEIERLRFIKRLVDESGVNLAGVQQLLSVAEAMQRIRPLMQPAALQRDATRRRVVREMDRLAALQRDATRRRLMREMDHLADLLGLTFEDGDPFDSDRLRDPRSGRGR
jgi:MerR family transcriptional regulator/heat shock protein HspR